MLETLIELFDARALSADGTLDVSLSQALALAEHEAALQLRWLGAERLAALAQRLRGLGALGEAEPPPGLRATLRSYQRHGLAWLQFIAGLELGGILADDMGLGKTSRRWRTPGREGGRPARPPRPSWSARPAWSPTGATRPSGSRRSCVVLTLHGADRARRFDADRRRRPGAHDLRAADARHRDAAAQHAWHMVVLDEAQAIKNPRSKAAQIAARLKAEPPPVPHRHADREPSGRAVVAVRASWSRACSATGAASAAVSARRSRSRATPRGATC